MKGASAKNVTVDHTALFSQQECGASVMSWTIKLSSHIQYSLKSGLQINDLGSRHEGWAVIP